MSSSPNLSHRTCGEDDVAIPTAGPPLKVSRETLSPLQIQVNIPDPIVPEGPMTRKRRRDENVTPPNAATTKVLAVGQSPTVSHKAPAKGKEAPTAKQPPRMTTRSVAPRQPARTRRAPVDVQLRKQPARNARKKPVQDKIPHIKSMIILGFSLSVHPAHITYIN